MYEGGEWGVADRETVLGIGHCKINVYRDNSSPDPTLLVNKLQ